MEMGALVNPSLYGSDEETTIFLKAMKTIPVKVKTTDTVKNIKARFREIEATSEEHQEFILAGKRLEDGRMLMEYHIRKNSTVDVILPKPTPMQVFIRIPSMDKHIMLELRSTDTVHNVKVKIHGVEGVPPDRQTLVYTGRTLEDGQKTLSDYRVRNQATIVAVFRPRDHGMRLGIRTEVGDQTVVVDVKGWYTIRDVKAIAKTMLGISQSECREIYDGKRLLEDDDSTVMDCMVKKGSILHYH